MGILVRLSGEHYEKDAGRWFLEAGFGRLCGPSHPTFADLVEAEHWVRTRLDRLSADR